MFPSRWSALAIRCKLKHEARSFYKSKKVLDINIAPMKSSVYVNGVSNRRGVWRDYYDVVVFYQEYRFCA
jgi:hypothetical protein